MTGSWDVNFFPGSLKELGQADPAEFSRDGFRIGEYAACERPAPVGSAASPQYLLHAATGTLVVAARIKDLHPPVDSLTKPGEEIVYRTFYGYGNGDQEVTYPFLGVSEDELEASLPMQVFAPEDLADLAAEDPPAFMWGPMPSGAKMIFIK